MVHHKPGETLNPCAEAALVALAAAFGGIFVGKNFFSERWSDPVALAIATAGPFAYQHMKKRCNCSQEDGAQVIGCKQPDDTHSADPFSTTDLSDHQ